MFRKRPVRRAVTGMRRRIQRYLVPAFLVTLRHYWKSRAIVSLHARVQYCAQIAFGRGTVVKSYAVIQSGGGGNISFGRDCAISSFVHVSTGTGDVIAGDFVRIGPNCTLVGGTHEMHARGVLIKDQPEFEKRGIHIGDDVLIGAGVVVLPGSRLERGAVIGAGSVVSGCIPEYAIAVGAPATVIGHRK